MAFLGLTYLGPQDSFRVNMKKSGLLAAFKDDEFASAFDAVAGDARTLDAVLQLVYRGPPLECDRDRVRAHLDDDARLPQNVRLSDLSPLTISPRLKPWPAPLEGARVLRSALTSVLRSCWPS